ncbi:MAG: L,D-transpeptidase [Pseudomonadota bacterium]
MAEALSNYFKLCIVVVVSLLIGLSASQDAAARQVISGVDVSRGTILVLTSKRKLYYGLGNGKAIRYNVGVGKRGRQWTGRRYIARKAKKPAWQATPDILKDKPHLTRVIPGGAPENPMGAAALLISGNGYYAIHGTNRPRSIGGYVSYGCIRMHNKDILDLYQRARIGTRVIVQN